VKNVARQRFVRPYVIATPLLFSIAHQYIFVLKEFMPEEKRLFPEVRLGEAFMGIGEEWPGGMN
jgi:hypothetical protein